MWRFCQILKLSQVRTCTFSKISNSEFVYADATNLQTVDPRTCTWSRASLVNWFLLCEQTMTITCCPQVHI